MKNNKWFYLIGVIALLSMALSACAGGQDAPAQTVLLYQQALVDKNQEELISYACADWESQALLELDSFVSVETELVDATCQTVSEDGDTAKVTCEGAISATYNGEAREFSLSGRTYTLVNENGDWRLCGYE
ncbi:hypothetical protein JR338_07095 [Chloroflexota bacterium]|nr:hypothetical protein JR338_07095 [Chloroflexota bacterium]